METVTHPFRLPLLSALAGCIVAACAALAEPALAQPTATEVLTTLGFSAADIQQVLGGQLVTLDAAAVSDRDLSVSMAFLVKTSPDALAKRVLAQSLERSDSQIQTYGVFHGSGSLADLSGLKISSASGQTLLKAEPGESLNLSTGEIAAFHALQGAANPQQAVQAQLQNMLLARMQAYQTSGLAGIAAYDRGSRQVEPADDLRKATQAAHGLSKYLPAFQTVLLGYPQATIAGLQQSLVWVLYNISGTPTYVLTQTLAAPDGKAWVVAQRQYYVSAGYNASQAVAGFLPVQEGTLVAYTTHTFTEQVSGFGSSAKQAIGRRMMATQLEAEFNKARSQAGQ